MSDQAIRIFEALSGVDGELLERCDRKAVRESTKVYRLLGKYGRTMAACICLIAVGAAAWSGYRFVTGGGGSGASGANQSPARWADRTESILTADSGSGGSDGGMTGNDMTAADGTAGDGATPEMEANELPAAMPSPTAAVESAAPEAQKESVQSAQSMASDTAGNMSSSGEELGSHTGNGSSETDDMAEKMEEILRREGELTDSRELLPWEEAIALYPFAGYVPTALPAGYVPLSARRSPLPDSWNNVIYKWSEGEHVLSLNMTLGEVKTGEDIEREDGLNEYLAGEFRKELIPEPLDGQICFTLYYGDGMRIDFSGYITVDEMWDIVKSVSE